jgi:hypothetical protein
LFVLACAPAPVGLSRGVLAEAKAAAVTVWTDVTVRVYDAAGLLETDARAALELARSTLSAAAIDVTWERCSRQAGSRCETPMAPRDLALRIVRPASTGSYRGAVPLGEALIDAQARRGVLATIYLDRVEWMARAAGVAPHALLGRAIAHELGHLLLASNAHSTRGLMRPLWSQDEIRTDRVRDWAFTARDIVALSASRLRETAGASSR